MTIATRLGEFAADASGLFVPGQVGLGRDGFLLNRPLRNPARIFDGRASAGRLEFDPLNVQRLDWPSVELGRDCFFSDLLIAEVVFVRGEHQHVDIFEYFARSDADDAIGRFDEVVAFASAMLAAEVIDETERRVELLGFD
jgi:hypothetical protein